MRAFWPYEQHVHVCACAYFRVRVCTREEKEGALFRRFAAPLSQSVAIRGLPLVAQHLRFLFVSILPKRGPAPLLLMPEVSQVAFYLLLLLPVPPCPLQDALHAPCILAALFFPSDLLSGC
jgi:hypothetical protein